MISLIILMKFFLESGSEKKFRWRLLIRTFSLKNSVSKGANDSMNDCGAHKDRHQKLGLGKIGEEALRRVVTHPALQGRPFILETPNEDDGYAREIAMVRKWQEQ